MKNLAFTAVAALVILGAAAFAAAANADTIQPLVAASEKGMVPAAGLLIRKDPKFGPVTKNDKLALGSFAQTCALQMMPSHVIAIRYNIKAASASSVAYCVNVFAAEAHQRHPGYLQGIQVFASK